MCISALKTNQKKMTEKNGLTKLVCDFLKNILHFTYILFIYILYTYFIQTLYKLYTNIYTNIYINIYRNILISPLYKWINNFIYLNQSEKVRSI